MTDRCEGEIVWLYRGEKVPVAWMCLGCKSTGTLPTRDDGTSYVNLSAIDHTTDHSVSWVPMDLGTHEPLYR